MALIQVEFGGMCWRAPVQVVVGVSDSVPHTCWGWGM